MVQWQSNGLVTRDSGVETKINTFVPFGNAFNPHYQVPWKGLKDIGPLVAYLQAHTRFLQKQSGKIFSIIIEHQTIHQCLSYLSRQFNGNGMILQMSNILGKLCFLV